MIAKRSLTMVVTGTILLLICFFSVWQAPSAMAQCGKQLPSSCITCHAQEEPVADKGEWHTIHANKDICIRCHGGNASTMDKELAHQGMTTNPLSDIYTDCHRCHPDYNERAEKFAHILGVTPGSCATPTAVAVSNVSSGPPPSGIVQQPNLVSSAAASEIFLFIAGGLMSLVLFCISACWLGEHRVKV
jgi:hypothetical protein